MMPLQSNNELFPTKEDLNHLGEAIIDIMDVYKLEAADIADGSLRISSNKTKNSAHMLTIEDCRRLANSAKRKGRLNIKVEWLEMELEMRKIKGEDLNEVERLIQREKDHHDFILVNFGKYGPGTNITGSDMRPYTKNKDIEARARTQKKLFIMKKKEIFPFYKNFPRHKLLKYEARADIIQLYREAEINKMCRGVSMTRNKEDHLRKSSFLHHYNPYLQLAPFKLTVASDQPFIGRVVEFLSLEESGLIKRAGGGCLKPRIYSEEEGSRDLHHFTAKEICYINHRRSTIINKIRNRFQLLMNLKFKDQFLEHENFQVVNYGHGGSLKMHQDHSPFHFTRRLTTFMVYLSTVYGGRTVFPVQGITEDPVEGDAVVWHTITAKGTEDQRTQHCACPVILGAKWVVNLGLNIQENWGEVVTRSGGEYQQWSTLQCQTHSQHYKFLHNEK